MKSHTKNPAKWQRLTQSVTAICLIALAACSEQQPPAPAEPGPAEEAEMGIVTGEVFYRERIALSPGAELVVTLEDVSKMDTLATVVGEMQKVLTGAPPYAFEIPYPKASIDERMRYSVRARILAEDKLLFTSTENIDPFADNAQALKIMLTAIARPSPTAAPADGREIVSVNPLATLDNTYWKLMSLNGQPVVMEEGQQKEAFLQLNAEELTVKGFGSCNAFNSSYTQNGNELSFGPTAATRKMCVRGMDTEQAFFELLETTRYYSIHENTLTLLSAEKEPLGTFESVYFQ